MKIGECRDNIAGSRAKPSADEAQEARHRVGILADELRELRNLLNSSPLKGRERSN